jgi:hypothetical protein
MYFAFDDYQLTENEIELMKQLKRKGLPDVEVVNRILEQRVEQQQSDIVTGVSKFDMFGFCEVCVN